MIGRLFEWLFISKKQMDKIKNATSDFSAGKISDCDFLRIVWDDYPY
jgi:hypothetical protein